MSSVQNITESFKGLSVEELLAIITAASSEAKKAAKVASKAPKEAKEKKGSMPKGVSPPQLHKPRAWVDFVLAHANANGWPAIAVKNKEELPSSIERDGKHVFESTGKPLNNKQAMSLSKQYWARKEATGTNKVLYDAFEAQYEPPAAAPKEVSDSDAEPESEAVAAVVPNEKKEKKAKKTEEEKEAEKARKTAEKEAEKVRKAAEKDAEKVRKAAEKELAKQAEKPAAKKEKPLKKVTQKEEEVELPFDIEVDGMVHEWVLKGKKVYVDSDGNMWERFDNDEAGPWMGNYNPSTKILDASAEEPTHDEE